MNKWFKIVTGAESGKVSLPIGDWDGSLELEEVGETLTGRAPPDGARREVTATTVNFVKGCAAIVSGITFYTPVPGLKDRHITSHGQPKIRGQGNEDPGRKGV